MAAREDDDDRHRTLSREVIEGQIRLYGSLYDKAVAYTNLVMAVGYAGVFGLWSFAREHLTARQALSTAGLLLVSLAAFVFFEVYRIFVMVVAMRRRATAMFGGAGEAGSDAETFLAKLQQFETENARDELRLARVWPWAWGIAVVFGVAAMLTLLFSILCRLVST